MDPRGLAAGIGKHVLCVAAALRFSAPRYRFAGFQRRMQNGAARFGDAKRFNRPVEAISFTGFLITSSRPRETNSSMRA